MANVPEPIYPEPIEIDPQVLEDDGSSIADFTDELNSFTTSASPSITAYPFENGRRYHAFRAGTYLLPNDDEELERLNIVHHMVKKVLDDRIFLCPLPATFERALDIGTGTGIWAIEMGDAYPSAEIIGNDLSPIQPSWIPPNVRFEVDDCESPWAYGKLFDFVFCRYMCASLLDWPRLMRQAYENVRPGGLVEVQDFGEVYSEDGTLKDGSAVVGWGELVGRACRESGRKMAPGPEIEGWMRDAGFVGVVAKRYKIPVGPWARDKLQKEVGLFNLVQLLDGVEALSLRLLTSVLKWTPEEVKVLCAKVKSELKSKSVHAILDFYVVYGQKPMN